MSGVPSERGVLGAGLPRVALCMNSEPRSGPIRRFGVHALGMPPAAKLAPMGCPLGWYADAPVGRLCASPCHRAKETRAARTWGTRSAGLEEESL